MMLWDAAVKFSLWVIQHSPRTVVTLFVASSLVLFGPQRLLHRVGLDSLLANHPYIVGLVFLISGVFTLTYFATYSYSLVRRGLGAWQAPKILERLTLPEKAILQEFYINQTKSLNLEPSNGVVRGLEMEGILFRVSETGTWRYDTPVFAYNLANWVWKEIKNNPSLVTPKVGV